MRSLGEFAALLIGFAALISPVYFQLRDMQDDIDGLQRRLTHVEAVTEQILARVHPFGGQPAATGIMPIATGCPVD